MSNTEVEASAVPRIIERQFPELAPVRASYHGAGMDSVAYEVHAAGRAWIFRFPMRADVERQLFVERRVLPAIAPRLTLPIPAFAFAGQPDADFPMHFAGYEKLPGVPAVEADQSRLDFGAIAAQLGSFLSALHRFPVSAAKALGAPTVQVEPHFEEVRASALAELDLVRRVAPDAPADLVQGYLEQLRPLPQAPWPLTLAHHDLAAEHILVDPGSSRVTGIIDWGDVAIVDPAVDFVGLLTWRGEAFVRAVLAGYDGPVDERVVERIRPWATFRAIQDVRFGVDHGQPDVVRLAVRALQEHTALDATD